MTKRSAALAVTRRSWHGVGELVLAGPEHRRSGTIRLRVMSGGFSTIKEPDLAVTLTELLVGDAAVELDGRTCAELAAAIGIDAGAPLGLYHDGPGVPDDEVLAVDRAAAGELAEALEIGDRALRQFAAAETPVLWPEHFDLAITVDEVNYGVSLGDSYLDEPYAYVGPWRARDGALPEPETGAPFWNAPFGAARPLRELAGVAGAVSLFTQGRRLAAFGRQESRDSSPSGMGEAKGR